MRPHSHTVAPFRGVVVVVFAFGLIIASPVFGQTVLDWNNASGGLYTLTTNWNPNGTPDSTGESARFNLNATYNVLFPDALSSAIVSDLLVDDGDVTFSLNAGARGDLPYMTSDDVLVDRGIFRLRQIAVVDDVNLTVGDQLAVFGGGSMEVRDGSIAQVNDDLRIGAQSAGGGDGALLVSGAGSALNVLGATVNAIGGFGHSGTLTLQQEATGLFNDDLSIAFSSFVGTTGLVEVLSDADLRVQANVSVGEGFNSGQSATLRVSGLGSTFIQTGAGVTDVGGATAGNTADILVADRAEYTTGTGDVTIEDIGKITVTSGGVFTANGFVTSDTAQSILVDGGTFNVNAGFFNGLGALDFMDGVVNINSGVYTAPAPGGVVIRGDDPSDLPHLVLSNGLSTAANGATSVGGGGLRGKLTIEDGSELGTTLAFIGEGLDGDGEVIVNGAGAAFNSTGPVEVGSFSGGIGRLTVQGGATASGDDLDITGAGGTASEVTIDGAGSEWVGAGTLTLRSGGQLTVRDGGQGSVTSVLATGSSSIHVTDAGSMWTSTGILSLRSGDLDIQAGGVFENVEASLGFAMASPTFPNVAFPTTGAVAVDGVGSTWTNTGELTIGLGGTGVLNVTDGASVTSSSGVLGDAILVPGVSGLVNGSGDVTIDGDGSSWSMTGDLAINFGSVMVTGGGVLENDNASIGSGATNVVSPMSEVTIDGAGSQWTVQDALSIAGATANRLTISNGGNVTSAGATVSGDLNQSTPDQVVVDGDGSLWDAGGLLNFGATGFASLEVTGGGDVSAMSLQLGASAGADVDVLVTGAGSSFTLSSDLYVGGDDTAAGGEATLAIGSGGVVAVGGTFHVWEDGEVSINGGTLQVDSTAVTLDGALNFAAGVLLLTDAAGYTVGANGGHLDDFLGGRDVTVTAGKSLVVEQSLLVPAGASINALRATSIEAGRAIVNDGVAFSSNSTLETVLGITNNADLILVDTVVEGPVTNSADAAITIVGSVDFNGLVSGPGGFFGPGTANFNGGVAPGASPAEVAFEGDISFGEENTLFIELAGDGPTEFDRLAVAGEALLGGQLSVVLIDGFSVGLGDEFEILSAGSVSGEFDDVTLPSPGFELLYTLTTVELVATSSLPGDYNNDGVVDAADYAVWRDKLGAAAGALLNDVDGGEIGTAQYHTWRANFGATLQSAPSNGTAAVPEQTSLFLLATIIGLVSSLPRQNQ